MRGRIILSHFAFCVLGLLIIFGPIGLYTRDYWMAKLDPTLDAVTSASVIIEQPGGNYIVLINERLHPDDEVLADWVNFFSGQEISVIFEDISCSVASSDPGAKTMGDSFRSRLPENQMTLQTENSTLLLSRMEHNLFDIVIMSEEFAEANNPSAKGLFKTIQIKDTEE